MLPTHGPRLDGPFIGRLKMKLAIGIAVSAFAYGTCAQAEPINVRPGTAINMRAGTAVTFNSPSPIFRVVVGNPAVLDVVPQTDRTIAIIAKVPGVSNFILLD